MLQAAQPAHSLDQQEALSWAAASPLKQSAEFPILQRILGACQHAILGNITNKAGYAVTWAPVLCDQLQNAQPWQVSEALAAQVSGASYIFCTYVLANA